MRFENEYGYCELNPFPGCNQIVVSNHAFVYPEHRGKGHGFANHQKRVARATKLGYNLIVCTVRANNIAEKKILTKGDWTKALEFTNTESGNQVELWYKELHHVPS